MTTKKLIGILILIAAAGLTIFLVFNPKDEIPEVPQQQTKEYRSTTLGFRLLYPAAWVVEASGTEAGTVIFTNPDNYQNEVVVIVTEKSAEQELLLQAGNAEAASTTLAGLPATELFPEESSQIDGRIVYVVKGEQLYLLTGSSAEFDDVKSSFEFLE